MRRPSILALVSWCLLAAGCTSSAADDDGTTGGGRGGGAPADAEHDLFACGVAPLCTFDMGHGIWDRPSESATRCALDRMASDGGGGVLGLWAPGPYRTAVEHLLVPRADGMAYHQERSRCSDIRDCAPDLSTSTWRRSPLELCRIEPPGAEVIAACEALDAGGGGGSGEGGGDGVAGGGSDASGAAASTTTGAGGPSACSWLPRGVDCVAVDLTWSCEALP